MVLFVDGEFVSHSGVRLPFKIDCDALSNEDLTALARIVAEKISFGCVIGVPRGGIRFAKVLWIVSLFRLNERFIW